MNRPQGARHRCRRRSASATWRTGGGQEHVAIGNFPHSAAAEGRSDAVPGEITVKGPLGSVAKHSRRSPSRRKATRWFCKTDVAERMRCTARCAALVRQQWSRALTVGFERKLNAGSARIQGAGAGRQGSILSLGLSHPVVHQMPKGRQGRNAVQTEIISRAYTTGRRPVAAKSAPNRPPERIKARACATRRTRRYQGKRKDVNMPAGPYLFRRGAMNKREAESAAPAKPGSHLPSSVRRAGLLADRTPHLCADHRATATGAR
jgi:large subunit ribosomal protein L6